MRSARSFVLAALLCGCAAPMQPVSFTWQHPDYGKARPLPRLVTLVSPEVEHRLIEESGSPRDKSREPAIRDELMTWVPTVLKERGMTPAQTAAATPEGLALGERLNAAYARISASVYAGGKAPPEQAASADEVRASAVALASAARVEALVLVRYAAMADADDSTHAALTGIGAVFGAATGVFVMPNPRRSASQATLEVALIDGVSGEVIWASTTTSGQLGVTDELVRGAMASFPSAGAARAR